MAYSRRYTPRRFGFARRRNYGSQYRRYPSSFRYRRRSVYSGSRYKRGGSTSGAYRRRAPARTGPPKLSKFALAHVDPFLNQVDGVRVPDANTMPSNAFKLCDDTTLSTNVAGAATAAVFIPGITAIQVNCTLVDSSSWTWPAGYGGVVPSDKLSSITGNYEAVRTVAHGVRISCGLAPTTVTGFLHIGIFADSNFGQTTWGYPVNLSQLSECAWYRRVPLAKLTQSEITIVNKFLDQTAFRYVDPNEGSGGNATANRGEFVVTHSWAAIVIAVEGAPGGTNPVSVEHIQHIEGLPKTTGVNTSSPSEPFQPIVMGQVSNMSANVEASHFESEQSGFMQSVYQSLNDGARAAGEIATNQILLPTARDVGYTLAGGAISAGVAGVNYMRGRSGGGGIPGVNSGHRLE